MNDLSSGQFDDYFQALHGRSPYSWQSRLAARAVEGDWPGAIDLPTGSGKTACIDIAIFALACQANRPVADRTAPRRIFFCVNRRVIVDEAHQRARKIAKCLWEVEQHPANAEPVLRDVAASLRVLAGTTEKDDAPPLDVLELRGGIYRDNRWARSATQPTVVCSTIDQLGSRLLFRGYGVSPNAAPIQAALIAYDSLILLDEAHISEPFRQTLVHIQGYLDPEKWAERTIGARPLIFVPMTATPVDVNPDNVIRLDAEDRKNEALARRLSAPKLARLRQVTDVAKAAVAEAEELAKAGNVAIGIIVNRVATAQAIHELLRSKHSDLEVELVIGSMRPIDRDEQSKALAPRVGPGRPEVAEKTSFVVATQCLEVGADYDFDVLITECASLDALRQRFGRLNRGGRPIEARAAILAKDKDVKADDALDNDNPLDPIYGNALAHTWNWLVRHATEPPPQPAPKDDGEQSTRPKKQAKAVGEAQTVDFGIDAFNELLREHAENGRIPCKLLAPSASLNAPVMLPSYVDFWCQTSPSPVPDPDVALFIHGPQRGEPDVQVCWRDDLDEIERENWPDVVALLPPTSAECMSLPISRVRRWLSDREVASIDHGDLLGVQESSDEEEPRLSSEKVGVLWRGAKKAKMSVIQAPHVLRPGDTLVLPVKAGWKGLGHVPQRRPVSSPPEETSSTTSLPLDIDVAETAFQRARGRAALRLHRSRLPFLPKSEALKVLIERVGDSEEPPTLAELRRLMKEAADSLSDENGPLRDRLGLLAKPKSALVREPYPDKRGLVLTTRNRIVSGGAPPLPALDDGDDDSSRTASRKPVRLSDHTEHVVEALRHALKQLPVELLSSEFAIAATLHDWGKADERFQAMLRRTDRTDAWLFAGQFRVLLAKSDAMAQTPSERREARERAGLPAGFRHEMLSVQLAGRASELPNDSIERDLILHLIAAHHGHGRPFAPVVLDDDPPDVEFKDVALKSADRLTCPPHRLDSGVAERFWSLTRRFGWWGLAYVEALLRLADQQASANEDAGAYNKDNPEPDEDNV